MTGKQRQLIEELLEELDMAFDDAIEMIEAADETMETLSVPDASELIDVLIQERRDRKAS